MPDPKTLWLTVSNIILGALVLMCVVAVAFAVIREIMARIGRYRRISAELDLDMRNLFRTHQGPRVPPRLH
jgi:hypothetical protein